MNVNEENDRAIERVIGAAEQRGLIVKTRPGGYMMQCSNHDDRDPSLSVTETDDGRVLLHCHAGCRVEDVVDALGLRMTALYPDAEPAEYRYQRADGSVIGRVIRRRPKGFHRDPAGCTELDVTPYRLPEVRAAVAEGRPILVVEGERDVETVRALGYTATCGIGGAGKWRTEHADHIAGATEVRIVRDQDPGGYAHAETARHSLDGRVGSVAVFDPVPGHRGADVTDHVRAGYDLDDLVPATNDEENEGDEVTNQPPTLHPGALHGLLGEIVRRLAPSTEASPAAMLVQLLAYVGALVGHRVTTRVGGSDHPGRVWPLVIGPTASGRKGESRAQVRSFVTSSPSFSSSFVGESSGLSTGEGVIHRLRGEGGDGLTVVVSETEFGRTLTVAKRENNTLSPVLRDLWDDGRAETMTKGDPASVNGAHLIVIAHVTPEELRLKLTGVDVSGGLANRYLMAWSQRSRLLADQPEPPQVSDLIDRFDHVITWAQGKGTRTLRRSPCGNRYWRRLYHTLAELEPDGVLGELVARASAYVARLGLLYAVADESDQIDAVHLQAALAVVSYSMDTAAYVFGGTTRTGDLGKLADAVRDSGSAGMTRTAISELFSRNRNAAQLDALISELRSTGNVRVSAEPDGKAGRPSQQITWTGRGSAVRDPRRLVALLDEPATNYEENERNEATNNPGCDFCGVVPAVRFGQPRDGWFCSTHNPMLDNEKE